ncbi:hypothetical protein HQN89_34005 [Paenibacillus frigoriresistens]|nr:hypothetical protein [Paenibacillus frigoriresistens]
MSVSEVAFLSKLLGLCLFTALANIISATYELNKPKGYFIGFTCQIVAHLLLRDEQQFSLNSERLIH